MGTCTVAIKKRDYTKASKIVIADVTFSTSYANPAGDVLTIKSLELDTIHFLDVANPPGMSVVPVYGATEKTDPTLRLFQQGAGAGPLTEVANATNESTITVRVMARGNDPYV